MSCREGMSARRGQSNTSAYHIERSIANRLNLHEYPCACNTCRGAVVRKVSTVAKHHVRNGRDPYLKYPILVSSSEITVLWTVDCAISK